VRQAPLTSRPSGRSSIDPSNNDKEHLDQQLINADKIEKIMMKNRQIIAEQQAILGNYRANYEKLYSKYRHLKDVRHKELRA